jgi:hypothetical protein
MRITAESKLIIGDTGSQSADLLQIETPASGGGHGIQIRRNDSNVDQSVGSITFGNNTADDLASISAKTDGATDNAALLFKTSATGGANTERLRIDDDGLKFNADTAAANALNDYEEGTWTPSLTYSGGNPATVSYNTQTGYYTKIGNVCYYACDLRLTAFSRGSASGTLQLQGLPFPTKNQSNYARPNVVPNLYNWPYQTDAGYQPMFGMFQDGVAKGDFSMMRPNAASTQVNDPDADSMLFLTGWYYTT